MNQAKTSLKRDTTSITLSEFFERYNLGKYELNPRYQRRGDVWDNEKQSFLIDTILKNYPMPPIFLHQRIDADTGLTKYDVIDGKQRLTAIIRFLKNEIPLPQDYDVGPFGDERLNGLFFRNLDGDLVEFKKNLWRYVLSIEYIDSEDLEIIDNVFDRLNRNGEPLESQELRKAKYHDTLLMETIIESSQYLDWTKLEKIKFNRLQDQEFVSELLFYLLEGEPNDASLKDNLDQSYRKWSAEYTSDMKTDILTSFKATIDYINNLNLNFDQYKIKGVSHFYALFVFCHNCIMKGFDVNQISNQVRQFYTVVRDTNSNNEFALEYRMSMLSNTKAKSQRIRRIAALEKYCAVIS